MRKAFSQEIEKYAKIHKDVIFLTADLGFHALENIRSAIGNRFINVGIGEQNMMSLAAGLASQGYTPICYSIAPFAVFRPAEQIRIDICLHNLNVKIVGNGGGYGYGIMGATHHAIEDIALMSSLQNMRCYIPYCKEDISDITKKMLADNGPGYLRLGIGNRPSSLTFQKYHSIKKICSGGKITLIALGPIALNAYEAVHLLGEKNSVDLFVISELPLTTIEEQLKRSIKKTGNVLIIEEHVQRGGLAEHLALLILKEGVTCTVANLSSQGYPGGKYGSQAYHQRENGLDPDSIAQRLQELTR